MGTRAITNHRRLQVRTRPSNSSSYLQQVFHAQTVISKLTGNTNFATPHPTLANTQLAVDALQASTETLGIRRNRSSKAAVLQAQSDSITVHAMLVQLGQYCTTTALIASGDNIPAYNAILGGSGFSLRRGGGRGVVNSPAQFVSFVSPSNSKKFPSELGRLSWKRPKGRAKGVRPDTFVIMVSQSQAGIGGVYGHYKTVTATNIIFDAADFKTTTEGNVSIDVLIYPITKYGYGNPFYTRVQFQTKIIGGPGPV